MTGAFLVLLGVSLALGLSLGRRWARFGGLAAALVVAALAWSRIADASRIADHLLLLGALATAALLLLPATGSSAAQPRLRRRVGAIELGAALGLSGLVVAAAWSATTTAPAPQAGEARNTALPAAAISRSVSWTDFAAGERRAREEGRPMLLTFVTDWCGYCRKMGQTAWKDRRVAERLEGLVAVRVDAEDAQDRGGTSGVALAERFQVTGYPVQVLLAPTGQVIDRVNGYQSADELLAWLDASLRRPQP
jgi:thiol:disulfide interchange protein